MTEKAMQQLERLDKELEKIDFLKKLDEQTKVPKFKSYLVIGVAVLLFVFMFFNLAGQFLCNLAGFIYPLYGSVRALEGMFTFEERNFWLTYWIAFGFLNTTEYFVSFVIQYLFFYWALRFLFLVWLVHPEAKGALVVYEKVIKPFLRETHALEKMNEVANQVADTVAHKGGSKANLVDKFGDKFDKLADSASQLATEMSSKMKKKD